MTQVEALAKIERLDLWLFETRDLAALLKVENSNANKIASRLARTGLIVPIRRGRWALRRRLNKLAIPDNLCGFSRPHPAL